MIWVTIGQNQINMKNNIKSVAHPCEHFDEFESWNDWEYDDGLNIDKTELLRRELKEEFDREMLRHIAFEDMEGEEEFY
ncbi:MAG: hypothetical protein GY751_03900 [Bacteroidetes bacterium]|nr:hypothetical protein [Bacteroidota bacterium]